MPLPPSYQCPVCPKKRQRGHIGDHVASHKAEEIKKHIINPLEVAETGAHPEVMCSGHKYVICLKTKEGFEKGFVKHKRHVCTDISGNQVKKVADVMKPVDVMKPTDVMKPVDVMKSLDVITSVDVNKSGDDMYALSMQEVIDICKKKNIRGYSQKNKNVIIEMIKDHDKNSANCSCHTEITILKFALQEKDKELELYKVWHDLILSNAPNSGYIALEKELVKEVKPVVVKKPEPNLVKLEEPRNSIESPPKVREQKHTIKASKKEQEKGMYCTQCEVCKCTARQTRDLKPCGKCNKLCHYNDDLRSCYHWECAVCSIQICMPCNKAAGGNKLNSFCSKECAKKHAH